jgi:hypothetical protein
MNLVLTNEPLETEPWWSNRYKWCGGLTYFHETLRHYRQKWLEWLLRTAIHRLSWNFCILNVPTWNKNTLYHIHASVGLRPLGCWGRGFESRSGLGCLSVVLSCVGRGLCDGLITRPEESYRVSKYMCDHRNPERGPLFHVGNKRKVNEWIYMLRKRYYQYYPHKRSSRPQAMHKHNCQHNYDLFTDSYLLILSTKNHRIAIYTHPQI